MPASTAFPTLGAAWQRARLIVLRRRRLLAALCAAVATAAGLQAVAAPPPPSRALTVAARDLPAGARLAAADLRVVEVAPGTAPEAALADPAGRVLAGPVAAGEPITERRLVGPALAEPDAGSVAVPLRLPDAGLAALLRVGDVVTLLATDPQAGTTTTLTTGARVLALPAEDDASAATAGGIAGTGGAAVVFGVPAAEVAEVSDAAARLFLSYVWAG